MIAIEFSDFSAFYKRKKTVTQALSHIDLQVEYGEFFVIVGESGSGKTTLLRSCLGLADLFDGDLVIDGVPIEHIDLRSGKFAYVKQEVSLYTNMTVYENLAYPLRVMKTPFDEIDRRVFEMADMLGIEYLLTRKPRQLSGGQQQRVAIGRAIIKDPTFVFFDEPFSNVDPVMRAELRELVARLHRQYRFTVLFVTHDMNEAYILADRMAVLERGRLAEVGTPAELRQFGKSDLIKKYINRK